MYPAINIYAVSGLLAGFASLSLGIFVLFKSTNRRYGHIWFLFNLSVANYGFGAFWLATAKTTANCLWAWRFTYAFGTLWIAPFFYHFISIFSERENKRLIFIQYLISAGFLLLLPTNFFFDIKTLHWIFNSFYYFRATRIYTIYFIWWISLVGYSHYELIKVYNDVSTEKKNQIKYFFCATFVGFVGGCTAYFPIFGIYIYPWGTIGVIIYPFIMSYAILRHHLMDVTVIVRRTVIYSILTAAITVIYVSTILVAQKLTEHSLHLTAISSATLGASIITLIFMPIRSKVQRFVDRYFFRNTLDEQLLQEMTTGIAHEMKRPLAGISMPAELTLMDIQDVKSGKTKFKDVAEKMEQRLQYIIDQSMKAAQRVEAIRSLSTPDSEPIQKIALETLINSSIAQEKALLAGVVVTLGIPDGLAIAGRKRQLEVVFVNLLKNAVEAGAKHIAVKAAEEGNSIQISIKDDGGGIPPEIMRRLFEPYFSTKGAKGMGLGLHLAYKIIKMHDGAIEARNISFESRVSSSGFTASTRNTQPETPNTPLTGAEFLIRLPKASQIQPKVVNQ